MPLTDTQINIIEAYLSLQFQTAYGIQQIVFYDTAPGQQDDADSALFFTNTAFPKEKKQRIYTQSSIAVAVEIAYSDSCYANAEQYIKKYIPPVKPKYNYPGEGCINPGYENIAGVRYPLRFQEKRIWALRSDFILATGVKNAYQSEYGYTGLKDSFSESVHTFLNWKDRYGHPSLTLAEGDYDGSAFYAGYICQRKGYLQVYLVSGRFERTDLSTEQARILEAYIASQFQAAYGDQDIVFDFGDSNVPQYHATFFSNGLFDSSNPQRRYNKLTIRDILKNIPETPRQATLRDSTV